MNKELEQKASEIISKAVDRFLWWKLPKDFGPDGGIEFIPPIHKEDHWWPVGTNLLTDTQAREMFEFVLKDSLIEAFKKMQNELDTYVTDSTESEIEDALKIKQLNRENQWYAEALSKRGMINTKLELENKALKERIKELESDNKIRVGDYVIYRDFPNAGWSQVVSIQSDFPSIEPLAHLVDEYGNTGTEPLRRLVKSNSPHLFAEKPNNRTAEKPKFGIPTTEEKRDIGHNDPDRGDNYGC